MRRFERFFPGSCKYFLDSTGKKDKLDNMEEAALAVLCRAAIPPTIVVFMPANSVTDISRACWAGLMAGDALGAAVEFYSSDAIYAQHPDGLTEMLPGGLIPNRPAGGVTDDTDLAVCLHRALVEANGWDPAVALRHYKAWAAGNPPDIGNTISSALDDGILNHESQANGALMRVAPIALWAAAHPGFDWEKAAREDAALTHPNPICAECNIVYVYALLQAMDPELEPMDIYLNTLTMARRHPDISEKVTRVLGRAAALPPDYDGESVGWVLIALQAAFYSLIHDDDTESGLVRTVSSGGDTDTNGAITGALLAVHYGPDSVPQRWVAALRESNPSYAFLLN